MVRLTTVSPQKYERDGTTFDVSYGDVFYRYCDGLLLTGRDHIFRLNMKDVVDLIPESRKHHVYWKIAPAYANAQARKVYLDSFLLGLNSLMQQRDGEPLEPYAFRRAVTELRASILTGLFD